MKKIKAGVVGVGRMGCYHVNVYSELFNVELAAIVDVNLDNGMEMSNRYNTKCYNDYRELFGRVDIVSIAVPTSLHYKIAKDFLNAGIHVLIEKPITHSVEEAEELFDIARSNNLTLHVGHVERFNGAVQELKKIVTEPILIESRRLGPFDPRIKDDGVILDLMIHDIDIILNLVDDSIEELNTMCRSIYTDMDDLANVQIKFKNGCLVNIIASRVTQNKIRTLAITQKDAYIFLDYTDQDIHIHRRASSEHVLTKQELRYKQESFIERIFVHRENPLKIEIKHFIDCAVNGSRRYISVDKELQSLKVTLEIVNMFKGSREYALL